MADWQGKWLANYCGRLVIMVNISIIIIIMYLSMQYLLNAIWICLLVQGFDIHFNYLVSEYIVVQQKSSLHRMRL